MSQANADRNLLFGMLALQMDFIKQDQLVAGMHAWVLEKSKPLGQLLVERGNLTKARLGLLDALVEEHIRLHGNDVEKSLAAVDSGGKARTELERIGDSELHSTLCKIPSGQSGPGTSPQSSPTAKTSLDPLDTIGGSVGAISASGLRFRVLRPHARGGLGEVLIARDEEIQREVALKQMQARYADEPDARSRFVLEAEITGGLEHPGIVPVYGLGQYDDGRPYYAMRFIRGDSLKEAVDRYHKNSASLKPGQRALEMRGLLQRFVNVCQAMAYAHSRGVLHRDLKPANIMLGKYGETLVVDWGLAKPMGESSSSTPSPEGSLLPKSISGSVPTLHGSVIGTPQYMSPEQAAGKLEQLGPASDVYSLGATFYTVLTGKAPFTDMDVGDVLRNVERGEFPRPREVKSEIPPPLEAICLKAMSLRAENRYASSTLMADDIERWLADEPVSCYAEPWTQRAVRWLRRHRTLALSVASAIVVALIGSIIASLFLAAANEREREAKVEAIAQKERAEANHKLAEGNFKLARAAVDRYHTEVSESVLLHEPGMEPLRKKLLEAAREYYEKFTKDRAGDPSVKGELGRAFFRLGQITGDIDSVTKAIELEEKARATFTELGGEFKSDLALVSHHLGRLHRKAEDLTPSRKKYEEAISLWKELREREPKNDTYLAGWARTTLGLGNVHLEAGEPALALKQYDQSLEVRKPLSDANRDNLDHLRDLAITHNNRGLALVELGSKEKDAGDAFTAALELQDLLVKKQAHISQYRDDLASTLYTLGDLRGREGPPDAALKLLYQARDHWELLNQRHPTVLRFRIRLAESLGTIAGLLNRKGENDKALLASQKSLDLRTQLAKENKDNPSFRGDEARGLHQLAAILAADRQLGDAEATFVKAATLQEELVKSVASSVEFRTDLARTYHELAIVLLTEKKLDAAEKALFRASDLWQELHQRAPEKTQFAQGLSAMATNFRQFLLQGGDPQRVGDRAGQVLEALKPSDPLKSSPAVTKAISDFYWTRADAKDRVGDQKAAIADWQSAIDLASKGDRPWLQLHQTLSIAAFGDYNKALKTADGFSSTKAGKALYLLSCTYSLAATAIQKDQALDAKERKARTEECIKKGIDRFTRARDAGYFKDAATRDLLSIDPSLDALRSEPAFQKVLSEVIEQR